MAYPEKKVKANQCMFILYPESQQAVIDYVQMNFPCAWALHDKDVWHQSDIDKWNRQHSDIPFPYQVGELKKPHVHFICKFPKSGRYFHAIAKELGVPVSTINRCSNLFRAYEYLTHKNDPEKYQYNSDMLAPGENRHFEPGEKSQFQPGRNRQSVPGGCSQPRFGYRF